MEFNIQPYYDDFEQNARENNYLKILFKPGFAVQARELTQIQSILQNQIKAFGDHIFQDGSPVIGGNLSLDNGVTYVKLDETYNNEDVELEEFVGKVILRDSDSLVQAKVLASYFPSGGTPTLMIKYLSGVNFSDGDVFKIAGTTTRAKCIDSSATGKGTVVSINDGIFYVDGYFVTITPQTAVVSAYSQNANVKIGLEITDEIIDFTIDSTLLDPAQESFNYQAPGADRYQFGLTLSTRPLETAVDESKFFELMRLENGAITKQVKYPIYSEIEKTLARRTFDESGDYTVIPFRASVSPSANDAKYMINIEPGKAYVKGFEFETIGTFRLEVDKPRENGIDTRSLVDIDFDTSYGNYIKMRNVWGSNLASFINNVDLDSVDIHCVTANSVAAGIDGGQAANTFLYGNTKIGTARVRNITRDIPAQDSSTVDSNGIFNFYFTDIKIVPRVLRVPTNSANASAIVLPTYASPVSNAYQNTSVTILPITLTPVPNVATANVFANSARVNANAAVASVFSGGNVAVGDIIRVGDETRQVVSINTAGDFLTVNSAFTKTVIGTNSTSNPLQVFRQADYSSNVTNQSRIITSYDGPTRTAILDRPFDDNAVVIANTIVQLNYSIADLKSLMEVNTAAIAASTGVAANAHANVAIQSLLLNGATEPFEASDRTLIFPLPQSTVKRGSLNNVDYNHTKFVEGIGAAGVFTILLDNYESIPWAITNRNIEDNLIAIVRQTTGGPIANGSVLKLTTGEVTPTVGGIQVTVSSNITRIDFYVNVKINDAEGNNRIKTFHSNPNLSTAPFNYPTDAGVNCEYTVNVPNVGNVAKINVANGLVFITNPEVTKVFPGDSINLYVPDVINIRAILAGNTTNLPDANNYQDITDHFVVDFGQTDEMYDHAKLILKQGYPSPNAQLTIHLDFFQHTYPAGATFFSVDSYENEIYEDGTIPVYYSDNLGTFFLRDCLDFRPTRRIGLADGTLDTGLIPSPDASTEISFDYFLPRIDKLVLSKNKEFRIIKGISSPAPVPPEDLDDAMTLYTIFLPPFVARIDDIRLRYTENRRYTMKDIARLDRRIESLEFYTALNNIEGVALGDSTKYEDGTDKPKYGVIGEGFKNFNIADYKDPDFNVSMEPGEMGPFVDNAPFGLKLVSVTNAIKNDRTVSLGYTEEPMISQAVTSNKLISVQPFLFAQFIGDMRIFPEVDFWVSETLKPDILRTPQSTNAVREIVNNERIVERINEPTITPTVPTPVTNATPVIITVPGNDPAGSTPSIQQPVLNPAPQPVVPSAPATPRIMASKSGFFVKLGSRIIRGNYDYLRSVIAAQTVTAPAPVPPAPTTPLPVYTAPLTATRTATSGGGGSARGGEFMNNVNLV